MEDYDYLIDYEGESTNLDFKAIQYKKETFHELLKDVIAMANAVTDGQKLIIVGVKKMTDNTFAVHPILDAEFTDSAIYQKLIIDHIEPEIHIDYIPHRYKGNELVGVFKIPACSDKPYMIKKDYGSDKRVRRTGESFIRKGTTTAALQRKDIDNIFERRIQVYDSTHHISLYFSGTQKKKTLDLPTIKVEKLPSQREAEKIQAIIDKKEKDKQDRLRAIEEHKTNPTTHTLLAALSAQGLQGLEDFELPSSYSPLIGVTRPQYKDRSIKTLQEDLQKVQEIFKEDDYHEIFEKAGVKINITVLNEGTKYLEDARLAIRIPDLGKLLIAKKIYRNPLEIIRDTGIYFNGDNARYPNYKQMNGVFLFEQHMGDLKHFQPQEAFGEPIRLAIGKALAGSEIGVELTLFGKNSQTPIKDTLTLKII